jgi:transposase InsO family protein
MLPAPLPLNKVTSLGAYVRGSQYCSAEVQDALRAYGMKSSMSRKADCWDNAPTESLWGALKRARTQG